MAKSRVIVELVELIRQEKKYWLLPIVMILALFGILLVFAKGSAVAPFIYSLF